MTPNESKTLGKIEQKLNDICISNTREHKNIKDEFKFLREQTYKSQLEYSKILDSKPSSSIFMWIIGGVFFCLISIGAFAYKTDDKVDDHINKAKTAYHEITGKEYIQPKGFK